uniref:Exosome complex component MTR3 n=1 Tax=Arion vulgaris TaxID=1028688 RepID=A0A0B7BKG3_9EUPU
MPLDTRRLNGPEQCFNPYDFCPTGDTSDSAKAEILPSKMMGNSRLDGRSSSQLRPIFLQAGVVSQARGSAYIEMNQTKVICAIYGPREVLRREDFSLKGQLTCDFKFATFSCNQRRQHQPDEQSKDLSVRILEAMESAVCLHKYPKSQINIYVTVLQNDGSALTAAIICASVAMASAGVEMYDIVLSSSLAVSDTLVLADPTSQEEDAILTTATKTDVSTGLITVAFLPSVNQISAVSSDGQVSVEALKQHLQVCIGNCQKVYQVVHQTLRSHLMKAQTC